jgi:hypothetical protein
VSRETLRKWMSKATLWRPRSQRVKKIHDEQRSKEFEACHCLIAVRKPLG